MIKSLSSMLEKAKQRGPKTVSVAGAADDVVLKSVKQANDEGFAKFILVGDEKKIRELSSSVGLDVSAMEIIDEPDPRQASIKAVNLVVEKKADVVMKGMVSTPDILKAVLGSELRDKDSLISHVAVFEPSGYGRLILLTDVAMNISPDLNQKIQLIKNAVKVAKALEIDNPKVALLSSVETVSDKIPSTTDAAIIAKMADRGQIKGALIDGPFGLDNAVSMESAQHKGIKSPVAGQADILVVPDIVSGNVLYKSIGFFANLTVAGIIVGSKVPVILVSRADSEQSKMFSIALGVLMV